MRYTGPLELILPDGGKGGGTVVSRNGNYLNYGGANGVPIDQDTLDRTITVSYYNTWNTPWYRTYTVKDANGTNRIYQLNFAWRSSYNPYDQAWENIEILTSMDLPNGRSYSFDYDHDQGFLTKVTLPSGGYIEFDYAGGNEDHDPANNYVVERRVSVDGSTEQTWTYARSDNSGTRTVTVTTPEPEEHVIEHDFEIASGYETAVRWRNTASADPSQVVLKSYDSGNLSEIETQRDSLRQVTTLDYTQYDWEYRLTQQDQSDWSSLSGALVPLTRTTTAYSSTFPRVPTEVELKQWISSSYVTQGKTTFAYDEYSLTGTSGVPNKSTPEFARRNVTTVRRYADASNYVEEHFYYDDLGNVVEHEDVRGKSTTFSYADNFSDSTNRNSYAYPTLVTNAEGHEAETVYNYDTGLPVSVFDARGLETEFTYDLLNRPATITPTNGAYPANYTYTDDPANTLKVWEQVTAASGVAWHTETFVDRLYRPIQVKQHDPAGGDVLIDTEYDALGRVKRVSAPYRTGSQVWTETTYDVLGRPVLITNPDFSTVEFEYDGNEVTTTDEAGNQRRETYNALGQLTKVEEPNPNLETPLATTYTYYAFGSLAGVTQGDLTRSFTVDWLGRMTQESHPEEGTTSYGVDAGGLVTSRTDARSITTSYSYDDIGRLLTVSYSDSTPDVTYTYDQNSFTGFLTTVDVDGVTGSTFEYNSLGLLSEENVIFDGVSGTFTSTYGYDLSGRLLEIGYPSGRTITRTYGDDDSKAVSRLAGIADSPTSATLLGSVQDNAAGQITARTLGGSIAETRSFNSRLQLTAVGTSVSSTTLLDLAYGYGSYNNGRIRSRTDGLQPEHSVSYTFDAMNRLTQVTASNPSWSINWTLDRYGNRTAQSPSGLATGRVGSPSISYTNNKNNAWTHDSSGNVTNDGTGGHNYTYDAESRLIQIDSSSTQYAYDDAGRRVRRTANGVTTYSIYGLTGLLSEFATDTTLSSASAAASTDRFQYRVGEQTGTAVLMLDANGTVVHNNRVFPFGEDWQSTGSGNDQKFTTYQRDDANGEAGLDYAMARYYASRSGRFMTPDPGHVGVDPSNPQSWNAYTYVLNDPINLVDPSGLFPEGDICTYDWDTEQYSFACPGYWDSVAAELAEWSWRLENTYATIAANAALRAGNTARADEIMRARNAAAGSDVLFKVEVCTSRDAVICLGVYTGWAGIRQSSVRQSTNSPNGFIFDITNRRLLEDTLRANPLFYEGNQGALHVRDTGRPNRDFRSTAECCGFSVQIDVGPARGYVDVDRFNPYESPLAHFAIEVLPGFIGKLFGR